MTAAERIVERSIPVPESGCWLWLGGKTSRGYGQLVINGKPQLAHRASHEAFIGPVAGLVVRHRCDTPSCVNPSHLLAGTQAENMQDCSARKRHHLQRITHCRRGHEYAGDNLFFQKSGSRGCRACTRIDAKNSKLRRRAK